jgi:molybdopterin-binding protein
MPELSVGEAAALAGVSDDTLRRWADAGRVASRRSASGHRLVDGASLAAMLAASGIDTGSRRRVASPRNNLAGLVTRVVRDTVMAQVELQCGAQRLVALISREAADDLGLEPGVVAVATVKATNVAIELPAKP